MNTIGHVYTDFTGLGSGLKAQRKMLITAVDVAAPPAANTEYSPEWQVVGAGVEDSSIEKNPTITTVTDILGETETTYEKEEEQQSLEPFTVRQGSKLHGILYNIFRRRAFNELSTFNVLVIEKYVSTTTGTGSSAVTSYDAYVEEDCTIEVQRRGGSSNVDYPITIHFSGKRTLGSVTINGGTITFTADT